MGQASPAAPASPGRCGYRSYQPGKAYTPPPLRTPRPGLPRRARPPPGKPAATTGNCPGTTPPSPHQRERVPPAPTAQGCGPFPDDRQRHQPQGVFTRLEEVRGKRLSPNRTLRVSSAASLLVFRSASGRASLDVRRTLFEHGGPSLDAGEVGAGVGDSARNSLRCRRASGSGPSAARASPPRRRGSPLPLPDQSRESGRCHSRRGTGKPSGW